MTHRSYDLHGVTLDVGCDDPAVADAVHRRFRALVRAPGAGEPDVRFRIAAAGAHDGVRRPGGAGRQVYDPPAGDVTYFPGTGELYIDYPGRVRVLCDGGGGSVAVAVEPAAAGDLWLLSRPMVTLPLVELAKRRGLFSLHAAAVALEGRGILIAGASGAGKSTLAFALLRAGFSFLGDDLVFLRPEAGRVRALAFPDELDVTPATAAWFPELAARTNGLPEGWPKHRVRVEEIYPGALARECAPAAVVLPRIVDAPRSELRPVDAGEALLELAPNVLLTEPAASQAHLDALAALVRSTPCYRLRVARDFERVAALARDLAA